MAKKSPGVFSGAFKDWEPVKSSPKSIDSYRVTSKPDRVAQEPRVVVEKYLGQDAAGPAKKIRGNPHGLGHSEFRVAKKKGALDSNVSAKTFVVSKNKIVGSQG
jgi:hypothetical protein